MNKLLLLSLFFMFFVGNTLQAAVLIYDFETEYSGGTEPVGPKPWITAAFSQVNPSTVQLELGNINLVADEYIGTWYFNFNDSLNVNSLNFNRVGGSAPADPSISTGLDAFNAAGGGRYDIKFDFPNKKSDRFGAGDNIVYEITGLNPLSTDMFNFLSSPSGGNGTWYSSAHVQPIGSNASGSGWVGGVVPVPEPSTYLMLSSLLGFVLFAIARSKRRKINT